MTARFSQRQGNPSAIRQLRWQPLELNDSRPRGGGAPEPELQLRVARHLHVPAAAGLADADAGRQRCAIRPAVPHPARPFPSSIFLDKNRRDIGKYQSIWTDSKMETAGSPGVERGRRAEAATTVHDVAEDCVPVSPTQQQQQQHRVRPNECSHCYAHSPVSSQFTRHRVPSSSGVTDNPQAMWYMRSTGFFTITSTCPTPHRYLLSRWHETVTRLQSSAGDSSGGGGGEGEGEGQLRGLAQLGIYGDGVCYPSIGQQAMHAFEAVWQDASLQADAVVGRRHVDT
jgi:hypothetical protein